MSAKLIVGLDGGGSVDRALQYAKRLAKLIGDCELKVAYVIEWSPYTFHTPEENESRHKRREEEIDQAMSRIVDPAVKALEADGFTASGVVRHGHVADTLNAIAVQEDGDQIIVGRSAEGGLSERIFGTSTANLVMHATVPVTVVG